MQIIEKRVKTKKRELCYNTCSFLPSVKPGFLLIQRGENESRKQKHLAKFEKYFSRTQHIQACVRACDNKQKKDNPFTCTLSDSEPGASMTRKDFLKRSTVLENNHIIQ